MRKIALVGLPGGLTDYNERSPGSSKNIIDEPKNDLRTRKRNFVAQILVSIPRLPSGVLEYWVRWWVEDPWRVHSMRGRQTVDWMTARGTILSPISSFSSIGTSFNSFIFVSRLVAAALGPPWSQLASNLRSCCSWLVALVRGHIKRMEQLKRKV